MTNKLIEVHNALCGIKVSGEDTITMARCLLTLRDVVSELQSKAVKEEVNDGE